MTGDVAFCLNKFPKMGVSHVIRKRALSLFQTTASTWVGFHVGLLPHTPPSQCPHPQAGPVWINSHQAQGEASLPLQQEPGCRSKRAANVSFQPGAGKAGQTQTIHSEVPPSKNTRGALRSKHFI